MIYHRYVATEKGGPEVLKWQEFEPGPPQHGEVAVKVEASGVLLADVLWQLGITPVGPKHPFTPGYDVVGVIEAVGPNISELEKGQRVAAMIQYGGYTEYAILPADKVVQVPDGVDSESAAAATTSYLTAYMLIHKEGNLQAGDVLLVHGAAGGTGSALVELAAHMGVAVYGTASESKHDLIHEKGGIPIDYRSVDFEEVVSAAEPDGVDMVVDPIGGEVTKRSLKLLKRGGTLVSTAMIQSMRGNGTPIPLQLMNLALWNFSHPSKRAYFWDVAAAAKKNSDEYRQALGNIFEMLDRGELRPAIHQVMPLREAPRAQQMLMNFCATGKVILDCSS